MSQPSSNPTAPPLWPGGRLGTYLALVTTGGAVALLFAIRTVPPAELGLVAIFAILCALLQAAPIPLLGTSLQGTSLSVSAAVSFAALLLWGPGAVILVNLGAAVMHSVFPQRRPFFKVAFNTASYMLAPLAAGLAYLLLGGKFPSVTPLRV